MEVMLDTETYFTVREAAARIGVSESAVRNATLKGRLSFVVKFGRKLIEREALAAYQRRTQPGGVKQRGRPRAIAEAAAAQRPPPEEGGA